MSPPRKLTDAPSRYDGPDCDRTGPMRDRSHVDGSRDASYVTSRVLVPCRCGELMDVVELPRIAWADLRARMDADLAAKAGACCMDDADDRARVVEAALEAIFGVIPGA